MFSSRYYDRHYRKNLLSMLTDREYERIDHSIQKSFQTAYIDYLEQEAVLKGHEGCVNCLEWSSDGRILASGSDDFQVILWDPFRKRRLHSIRTRHLGNMFSVKFLPHHNDSLIVTGAADKHILVYDLKRSHEPIIDCSCHSARVKRIATAPDSPFVFWSAGEDGCIMQLDTREHHVCRSEDNHVRLIHLIKYIDAHAEAKCLAINPRKTELLAVGANDPYARIYDRRMLRLGSSVVINTLNVTDHRIPSIPKDCVTYYCPGHINKSKSRIIEYESRAITYLTFNAIGTELLVNMGGEHVYLYDLQTSEQPVYLKLPEYSNVATVGADVEQSADEEQLNGANRLASQQRRKVPEHIESFKKLGNEFLENEKYLQAIDHYSEAIALAPDCAVLYLNRATAYMRRMWFGDVYAAIRDCHQALRLDPSYIKAHFRLARALHELGRSQEADECLKELINRFPSYANNHGVMMLAKEIKENKQSKDTSPQNLELNSPKLTDDEYQWRSKARDYRFRFVGHCNTTTDIKEANYFGYDGDYIVAGSDDGNFFIWERKTCKIRAVYRADEAIVNCVQPHPEICAMATSGIDHDIKVWAPIAPAQDQRPNLIQFVHKTADDNQQKMKTDPFELSTRNTFCLNG